MGTGQPAFSYSDTELHHLESLLSKERLTSYGRADLIQAVKDYEQNTCLAEAFYGVLQGVEISLRNSIHNVMAAGLSHTDWYTYVPWETPESDALDQAKDKLLKRAKNLSPGAIIAELMFGFWVQMTARKYEKSLWVPYVHKAFPRITTNRKGLNARLHDLLWLRNRIAHHERILHLNLQLKYNELLETVSWICPTTTDWIDSTNRCKKQLWP